MDVKPVQDDVKKVEMVKNILLNTFTSHYQQLQQFVHQLPIPQNLKNIVLQEFDTGYLWGKEALNFLQFQSEAQSGLVPMPAATQEPLDKIELPEGISAD